MGIRSKRKHEVQSKGKPPSQTEYVQVVPPKGYFIKDGLFVKRRPSGLYAKRGPYTIGHLQKLTKRKAPISLAKIGQSNE